MLDHTLRGRTRYPGLVNEKLGFNPTKLFGLNVWLDASQLSGFSNDDPVASFIDYSGYTHHFTQATEASQPLYKTNQVNGLPALYFDGSNDSMNATGIAWLKGGTLLMVCTPSSIASRYLLSGTGENGGPVFISGYTSKAYEWYNNTERYTIDAGATGFNFIGVSKIDGGDLLGYFNNTTAFTQTSSVNAIGRIISSLGYYSPSGYAQFYVAELIFYNRALSAAEMAKIQGYINRKYALW